MEAKRIHASQAIDRPAATVGFSRIDSPEIYIGYGRARNFSSPEAPADDRVRSYTAPGSLRLNGWALRGAWKITRETALLEAPGGGVRFHFKASQINPVMGSEGGKGVAATVLLDGKRIPPDRGGVGVKQDGDPTVGDSRLYDLGDLSAKDGGDHVFEIDFDGPGVSLYAFTFGGRRRFPALPHPVLEGSSRISPSGRASGSTGGWCECRNTKPWCDSRSRSISAGTPPEPRRVLPVRISDPRSFPSRGRR